MGRSYVLSVNVKGYTEVGGGVLVSCGKRKNRAGIGLHAVAIQVYKMVE